MSVLSLSTCCKPRGKTTALVFHNHFCVDWIHIWAHYLVEKSIYCQVLPARRGSQTLHSNCTWQNSWAANLRISPWTTCHKPTPWIIPQHIVQWVWGCFLGCAKHFISLYNIFPCFPYFYIQYLHVNGNHLYLFCIESLLLFPMLIEIKEIEYVCNLIPISNAIIVLLTTKRKRALVMKEYYK